jgi:uncharacterized SAM-binding protein YcdF (DUF218 family)
MDFFFWRKVLTALVLPPIGPLALAILGAALLGRRPRLGRALLWSGLGLLVALSTWAVADGLLRLVDDSPPVTLAQARSAQAIVILGGGVRQNAPEFGGDTVGHLTLERVRYGALVARATDLPVLVTGGSHRGSATEASVMRQTLEREFGVQVRWTEDRSRNTHENAQFSAARLEKEGVKRVVLVAHGFDMRRARAEFTAAGLEVVPAPTFVPSRQPLAPTDLIPDLGALQGSYYALYELLANLVLKLKL